MAIASADHTTTHQIAAVFKDCCQNGYADRAAIWAELTPIEQHQFQSLLAPPSITRNGTQRIRDAIGYKSPAVAAEVQNDLEVAINARKATAADVVAVVGAAELARFKWLAERCPVFLFLRADTE